MLPRLLLACIAFSALFCLVTADSTQLGCGVWSDESGDGMSYDFSSLTNNPFYYNDNKTDGFAYFINICGVLTKPLECLQQDAKISACQVSPNKGPYTTANAIGLWPPISPSSSYFQYQSKGSFGFEQNSGVTYSYIGSQECYVPPFGNQTAQQINYTATVNFVCADSQGNLNVTQSPKPYAGCTEYYSIPTPLACGVSASNPAGGGGSKGISGGWIFIIILVIVIPLYIIGGCIYKHTMLGSQGIEKCPNIEFWRDLPGLVKDGCAFTWALITSPCGGSSSAAHSGSAAGQSYEPM